MITKKEFYRLYNKNSPTNGKRNEGPIDAKLFLRDLSLPIAYFLAKKGVKANPITLIFIAVALLGNFIFIIPSVFSIIFLIILHEISQLLDCVDGQLARFHKEESKFGKNLDTVAHTLISCTFVIAFGSRLYIQTGNQIFIVLGILGVMGKAFEHQMIIGKNTILDNVLIKNSVMKVKFLRYVIYLFESVITEVRLFGIVLLILTLVQNYFVGINLVQTSFVFLVVYALVENLLYKFYLSIKTLNLNKQNSKS